MYERCPPAVVNKIVGEVFDSALKSRGFQKASPRKYVRPRIAHTHDVVELHSDVTRLLLIWGLSLNLFLNIRGDRPRPSSGTELQDRRSQICVIRRLRT